MSYAANVEMNSGFRLNPIKDAEFCANTAFVPLGKMITIAMGELIATIVEIIVTITTAAGMGAIFIAIATDAISMAIATTVGMDVIFITTVRGTRAVRRNRLSNIPSFVRIAARKIPSTSSLMKEALCFVRNA